MRREFGVVIGIFFIVAPRRPELACRLRHRALGGRRTGIAAAPIYCCRYDGGAYQAAYLRRR